VTSDLTHWWRVLRPDGLFVGGDYSAWPEVKRATDDFLASTPHADFQAHENKCAAFKR